MQTRTKTDAVDAAVLAQFTQRMPFTPWLWHPRLRAPHRSDQPAPHPNQEQLHAAQQTTTTPDFLIASRHQSIAHFDAQIGYLRRQVFDLIAADEALRQSCKLFVSAIGIAAASAI